MKPPCKTWLWLLALTGLVWLSACGRKSATGEFLAFDRNRGCAISVPENPSAAEQRAAQLIQSTLAKASGRPVADFPILTTNEGAEGAIHLAGSNHRRVGQGRLEETVALKVVAGRVEISSYPTDAIEAAAAWFLETKLGARWFMPGPLGEHIPKRAELRLPPGDESYAPSYISRNLGLAASAEEQDWWNRNRLRAWFKYGHAMSGLFSPEDLRQNPDLAPQLNGRKFFPSTTTEGGWQPNIAAEGAAAHAAEVLGRRREFSSPLGMNDSMSYDQSQATHGLLGEPRWFRLKPDYSKLVFRFINDVARRVPGRYLGAYAYDWTENTPGFPIERNVVPFLTADRSEWFDPKFAEEDKALIKRWVAAGAEVVGLYDYYYGAPYLVPRPTLYAVSQSIPFAHQAGVRAFFAEVNPNWGLDGPKAWLAAQLLWDATAKPEDLLAIYYRDFWGEAAGPMREYFALCDNQWLNQPKPSYWIKYYKDEHQHLLFPAEVRGKLRDLLAAAQAAAHTELTRKRVEFFAGAFAVTDAFCAWEEAKEQLSRLALAPKVDRDQLRAAWQQLDATEAHLKQVYASSRQQAPLAVKADILGEYERNDPRKRAAWRLKQKPETGNLKPEGLMQTSDLGASGPSSISGFRSQVSGFPLRLSGIELLRDPALAQLTIKSPTGSMDLEWVQAGSWHGHGEPYETRRVAVVGDVIRFVGCKQETLSQFAIAEPGKWYAARVKVKALVSPGNMTFLILNFQDEAGKALGLGTVDRLPVGDYKEGVELVVWVQAPANAKWVGMGVRALNQVESDYAEFSGFSLQALAP